jgi:hypothetical protein
MRCCIDLRIISRKFSFFSCMYSGYLWVLILAMKKTNVVETCAKCGSLLNASLSYCSTCRRDVGAPNVRACRTKENTHALNSRFETSRKQAYTKDCKNEFKELEAAIKERSSVVISMPANIARSLVEDPKNIYSNYERLVGAQIRKPADLDDDRHRRGVVGILFGSYAEQIVYGALSLTDHGLPTYGDVYCRLRPITIENRTSFLEVNSFIFVKDHKIAPDDKLPIGYTACWNQRHCLVLVKLADRLLPGQTESDWQALLICSDGSNRENDDFIEAHIFELFDVHAIESMTQKCATYSSKAISLDVQIAISEFNRGRRATK